MGGGGGDLYSKSSSSSKESSNMNKDFDQKEKEAIEKLKKEFDQVEHLEDEKTNIFISHQNRDDEKTQRAHQYADYIKENSDFDVTIDKEFFPKQQITNLAEINKIVSDNLRNSDIFVALYHPVKESSRYERSAWYNLEAQKAKFWGKPMIHVFLDGSHDSGVVESSKSYKIHYMKGEHWKNDLIEQIKIIAEKHREK